MGSGIIARRGRALKADIARRLGAFRRDESGVVAVLFGLAILPTFALAGGATDYARAARLKTELQSAVDAAALEGARRMHEQGIDLNKVVEGVLRANLPEDYRDDPFTATLVDDDHAIQVAVTAKMDNYFLGLLNAVSGKDMSSTTITAMGEARAGEYAEVAVVVDLTTSMTAHVDALKKGTRDLVDILFAGNQTSSNVKVSLVPYVTTVNISSAPSLMAMMDTQGKARWHGNWFELAGKSNIYVNNQPECLKSKPKPKPKPVKTPGKSPSGGKKPGSAPPDQPGETVEEKKPAAKPAPKPAPKPKPKPKPKPVPKPKAPSDLDYVSAPAPEGLPSRLASLALSGAADAARWAAGAALPSAQAKPNWKSDKDKKHHKKWKDGNGKAWRDMEMETEFPDCAITYGQVNLFDIFAAMEKDDKRAGWKGCVEMRAAPYDVRDTAPSKAKADTKFVPFLWPDELDKKGKSVTALGKDRSRNSYIDDDLFVPEWVRRKRPEEGKNNDWRERRRDHGAAVQSHLWKYAQKGAIDLVENEVGFMGKTKGFRERSPNATCPDPIVPLTGDRTALDSTIDGFRSYYGGGTNTAMGMVWGWRTLSPGAPYTEGKPYGEPRSRKIIVLMTDGVQSMVKQGWAGWNRSDFTGIGYANENRLGTKNPEKITKKLDEKLLKICKTVKEDHDIEVFTIMYNPDKGGWMSDVRKNLKACATDAGHAYEAESAGELIKVFNAIGQDIGKLRLSR